MSLIRGKEIELREIVMGQYTVEHTEKKTPVEPPPPPHDEMRF